MVEQRSPKPQVVSSSLAAPASFPRWKTETSEGKKGKPEMGVFSEKIRNFILETMDEMRKSTWPTREQLFESTILVIVALILSTIYLAGIDQILYRTVRFLTTF